MKRLILLCIILLAACNGDPLPTPTPTPMPTPTPDPDIVYFEPVNPNSDLSAPFHVEHIAPSTSCIDPRNVVVPDGFTYVGHTACGTAPHILNDADTGDFKFEVDNIGRPLDSAGNAALYRAGFGYTVPAESMYWLPAGRYVYVLKFAWIDLEPLPGQVWQDGNVSAWAKFVTSDGRTAQTVSVPFPRYGEDVEIVLGVIQNDTPSLVSDAWFVDIIHRTIGGGFLLTDIELQRVPATYGADVVVSLARYESPSFVNQASSEENPVEIIEFLESLFAVLGISTIGYTGSLIILLVELWKRFVAGYLPEKLRPSPQVLVVVLVGFFFAAHGLAVELEYDSALREIVEFITKLVDLVGPYIFSGTIANVAVALGYRKARAMKTPGFGFKSEP